MWGPILSFHIWYLSEFYRNIKKSWIFHILGWAGVPWWPGLVYFDARLRKNVIFFCFWTVYWIICWFLAQKFDYSPFLQIWITVLDFSEIFSHFRPFLSHPGPYYPNFCRFFKNEPKSVQKWSKMVKLVLKVEKMAKNRAKPAIFGQKINFWSIL